MIRINLLPLKAAQKKEKVRNHLIVLTLVIVVSVAGCAVSYFYVSSKIAAQELVVAKLKAERKTLKSKIGEVGKYKKLQSALQSKLDVLDSLREGKTGPVRLLDELSTALPGKMWLTKFSEKGATLSVNGVSVDEETVASFMRSLNASLYYRSVELKSIKQIKNGGRKLQEFSLVMKKETPPKITSVNK